MYMKKYIVDSCGSRWCGLTEHKNGFLYHEEDINPILNELAELRAYKEAADGQKAAGFVSRLPSEKDSSILLVGSQCDNFNIPLYARPTPSQHRCAECGPVDAGTALYCVKCWDSAHKPAVAVPDGWKPVPIEPVDAQQMAGASAIRMDTTAINKIFTANRVYRDMVAAAPSHESEQGGGE